MSWWPLFLTFPRPPDFIIGGVDDPYMKRWWVIPRNRWFNIYLHRILKSDDDRALHDHPWMNLSIILRGAYYEYSGSGRRLRSRGSLVFRRAEVAHRLEVVSGRSTWTLFITGPVVREWGFICPQGWRHWREFTDSRDSGSVGKGCE